jgi:hypothetical protein
VRSSHNAICCPPYAIVGEHSLVIYLAFFLPMAGMRAMLIQTRWILDAGIISVLVTIAATLGALCLWWLVRNTRCRYLFARPERFRV